jgi:hypothetical protein
MLAGREARDPLVTTPLAGAPRERLREQHHSAFVLSHVRSKSSPGYVSVAWPRLGS